VKQRDVAKREGKNEDRQPTWLQIDRYKNRRVHYVAEPIARADADDTMPGNLNPTRPRYAFGEAVAADCAIASKEAKRLAINKLGMKPKHVKCRCSES
jgi:hypothetical protein